MSVIRLNNSLTQYKKEQKSDLNKAIVIGVTTAALTLIVSLALGIFKE